MASTSKLPTKTREWFVAENPGPNIDVNKVFKLRESSIFTNDVPDWDHAKNHVLIKTKWLSNDPAQRTWITPHEENRHYVKPTQPGSVMPSGTVGEVLHSTHKDFKAGDIVGGAWGWTEYLLADPEKLERPLRKVENIDPVDYLALSLTALTAHIGLLKVGDCTSKDRTVVVSGAAGATGSTAVQIAKKVLGCERVIAIAGSEEKCKLAKETCGADIALNYKDPDFEKKFIEATPNFVDVYFDNVGTILDMVVKRIAKFGRVVTCGAIGFYDKEDGVALTAAAYYQIVFQEARIKGFIVNTYADIFPQIRGDLKKWVSEGKLNPLKTPWKATFEEIPQGMVKLLNGDNTGKLVTVLQADDIGKNSKL